jgi:hypothetical protein
MASKLDYRLEPGLRVRAGEALQESVRLKALAAAAKTGRSTQVMEQCVQRYG